MKKKLVSTILAATAVGSMLVTGVSAEEAKTYNIGICQLVQHVALDAATEGFKDALTDRARRCSYTLMSRMHRAIPIPAPPLSTASFPTMWT